MRSTDGRAGLWSDNRFVQCNLSTLDRLSVMYVPQPPDVRRSIIAESLVKRSGLDRLVGVASSQDLFVGWDDEHWQIVGDGFLRELPEESVAEIAAVVLGWRPESSVSCSEFLEEKFSDVRQL